MFTALALSALGVMLVIAAAVAWLIAVAADGDED